MRRHFLFSLLYFGTSLSTTPPLRLASYFASLFVRWRRAFMPLLTSSLSRPRPGAQFLENGDIVNSVNFPETRLEARSDTTVRIAIVNENKTGVLASILGELASANINILQQVNRSRDTIAYNVIDVELDTLSSGKFKSWAELQEGLTMVDGVISSRFMNDVYGTGYAKQISGQYFV